MEEQTKYFVLKQKAVPEVLLKVVHRGVECAACVERV